MKGFIKYVFLLLACPVFGQAVVYTAGVNYTSGAPTHNPGKANSRIAIDTVTWIRYEHVVGTTWTATGYAWQEHSGCTAPSATPTKHESIYKTNTCSPPKMYKWTGAAWEEMGGTGSAVITASNGLYKPTSTSVKVGGSLVENTNINGKATYTLTLDSMYLVTIKANRTSGTGASRMTMGSSNLIGVDIVHYNPADLDNIGQITANFNTGNVMSLANGGLITSFTQYLSGGNYRSEWYASNGSSNRILELGYNDFKIKYLERQSIADNTAFAMWDSITGGMFYQSPDIMASLMHKPDSTFGKGSIGAPSYAGKTLGTAVFRTGRTGFKTANTTGVVNISPGFGTSVPAISIPDSCDIILSVGADSRGDSISKFQITNRYVDNSTEVGDDNVFWAGFNTTSVGGKIASARASAAIGIKEKFDVSTNGILRPSYVVYAPFINLKTSGDRSPLSGFFGHEAAFGGAWIFNTDYLTFKDYKTATTKAIWGFGENGFTKGIDFQDTAQLRFGVNNWNIFTQKKAGSGFVNVMKVNASDEIQIGGGGETRTTIYNSLRLSNSAILYNEFGELNIGTATYPTRLLVENSSSNLLTLTRTGAPYTNTLSMFGDQFYYQSSSGTTPFKVFLGAPSNALLVNGSGLVGIGQGTPLAQLHVTSSAGTSTTKMLALENAAGTVNFFRTNVAPESAVMGGVSDVAFSNIAGDGKMYLKRSGTGNTGWGEVLTNTNGASGTNTYLPKFTAANTLSNSAIYDDGSASIVYPWGYGMKIQFSGSYNMGVKRGSGRDLELYAVSPDGDADITFKPGGGVAMTAKHDGKVGVGTTSPAQTFHVEGTARITGSNGTATTIMGRDADGDISDISLGSELAVTSGTLAVQDGGIGPDELASTTVVAGTYGTATEPTSIEVDQDGRITGIAEIPWEYAAHISDPTSSFYAATEKRVVDLSANSISLTFYLTDDMHELAPYYVYCYLNATNTITIAPQTSGAVLKVFGDEVGTATSYVAPVGAHLMVMRKGSGSSAKFYVTPSN